jgi:uncharacterized membrane protein YjgN (DUF898 family)
LPVKSQADFVSGLMFTGIGIAALVIGLDYPAGTVHRMGPGMLPILVSALLIGVGIALSVQSCIAGDEDGGGKVSLPGLETYRAAFFVLLALLAFGLLIRPAGLFLATVVLVLVSSRAEPRYSLVQAGVLSLALAAMVVAIFVYGLGLPFRVWP